MVGQWWSHGGGEEIRAYLARSMASSVQCQIRSRTLRGADAKFAKAEVVAGKPAGGTSFSALERTRVVEEDVVGEWKRGGPQRDGGAALRATSPWREDAAVSFGGRW